MHKIATMFIGGLWLFFSPMLPTFVMLAQEQDLSKTVLPISEFKIKQKLKPRLKLRSLLTSPGLGTLRSSLTSYGADADFATGFCLDPECRFIGANYHVAATIEPRKIKGGEVTYVYLATGPDDKGATAHIISDKALAFVPGRDLAIFELMRPLHQYHGISFSVDDLALGQDVEIYGYPKERFNPIRKLRQFHATYIGETADRLLSFKYSFSDGKPLGGGASGGLVVDSNTHKVVGILYGGGQGKDGSQIALAVSTRALADFVNDVQPWLAKSLFPTARFETISPTSLDLHPKFVESASNSLEHRPDETPEVKLLREKAQTLVDGMKNYISILSVEFGSQNNPPFATAKYEVQITDGIQRYRKYPDGQREFDELPLPRGFMARMTNYRASLNTANEWNLIPQMVGKVPKFKIHQFPDAVADGHRIRVFQYRADIEDDVCEFDEQTDFIFAIAHKYITTPCYGEVWTDAETNILRISEHDEHIERYGSMYFKDVQYLVTFGWLKKASEPPRLIPIATAAQGMSGKKLIWCHGVFKDYRQFKVQTKLGKAEEIHDPPQ